jgi:hypothetical protein
MKLRDLFGRQSDEAFHATPMRSITTWVLAIASFAIAWSCGKLLPWWCWAFVAVAQFVGFSFLGRLWADKDIAAIETAWEDQQRNEEDPRSS